MLKRKLIKNNPSSTDNNLNYRSEGYSAIHLEFIFVLYSGFPEYLCNIITLYKQGEVCDDCKFGHAACKCEKDHEDCKFNQCLCDLGLKLKSEYDETERIITRISAINYLENVILEENVYNRAQKYSILNKICDSEIVKKLANVLKRNIFSKNEIIKLTEIKQELLSLLFKYNDLSGIDLSKTNLQKAFLTNANLSGSNLSGANLYRANLLDANLSYADLSKAVLENAYMKNVDLSYADLSNADLYNANLFGANLLNTNLTGAVTNETIFKNIKNKESIIKNPRKKKQKFIKTKSKKYSKWRKYHA